MTPLIDQALRQSLIVRINRWQEFRSHIALRCKHVFQFHLSQRGYYGKILFNHDQGSLQLRVCSLVLAFGPSLTSVSLLGPNWWPTSNTRGKRQRPPFSEWRGKVFLDHLSASLFVGVYRVSSQVPRCAKLLMSSVDDTLISWPFCRWVWCFYGCREPAY